MMDYKLEELKLFNMKKVDLYVSNPGNKGGYKAFSIEKELSIEEKIKIIDSMHDGIATYLLNIFEKWESEKDELPKDTHDKVKKNSKKAWIKRNDTRVMNNNKPLIDVEFTIGKYYLFKSRFEKMSTTCPKTEYGYDMAYTGKHIAEQWFHDLCKQLYIKEKQYFEEHDTKSIKLKKIREYIEQCGTFDIEELRDIWNGKGAYVSEGNLDLYIQAFEKFERQRNVLQNELEVSLSAVEG